MTPPSLMSIDEQTHMKPAPLHHRLVARILDLMTVFALLFALVVVQIFWFMGELSDRFQPEPWGRSFVATLTFVTMSAVYEIVFVSARGQTPGKEAMNVKVVRGGSTELPSVGQAALRWALPWVSCIVWPFWLAATIICSLGLPALLPGRRSIHDRLAGTRVIQYDSAEEEGPQESPDHDEIRRTYGPRSIMDAVQDRVEREPKTKRTT